jgi:hypothetical protein
MRRTVPELEHLFAGVCHEAYPHEWDENHISFLLMRELRRLFSNKTVRFTNFSKIVDWHSFKNRGKQETNYGDIALLVNIQFTTGETLKGVACLEAKRQFISGSFESLELPQVQHIHDMVPNAHLLLYRYRHLDLPVKFPDDREHRSHIWSSPLNTVRQLLPQVSQRENDKLFRIAFPFAMFLTARIFWGHDLDYRTDVYDDLVAGNNKLFDPAYLGVVNIYYEHQRPVEVALGDSWEEI